MDTAEQSDKKQYILITPQDMGNIQIKPSVRVNRMPDPERGQGILAFGSGSRS
jgi:structural maintenance of chromosomes protein 6